MPVTRSSKDADPLADREETLQQYALLVLQVDERTAKLSSRYQDFLACRPGCWGCCHHSLSVFPLEAVFLDRALRNLPLLSRDALVTQHQSRLMAPGSEQSESCPLLFLGCCAVYEKRPIICRTQGLPLLIEGEEGSYVDVCPMNFTSPESLGLLSPEYTIPLEEINVRLAVLNLCFCRTQGISDQDSGCRIPLRELLSKL